MYDLYKMKMSLKDIESLIDEVDRKLFIPKKFRKAPFTEKLRNNYVAYLKREAANLARKIETFDKGSH